MAEIEIDPATIVDRETVTLVGLSGLETATPSRRRRTFEIVRTNQRDSYRARDADGLESLRERRAPSDEFTGKRRRRAKITILDGESEEYESLRDLLDSLPADREMKDREPPIRHGEESDRVEEEQRNVRVHAYLWAACRPDDNDFHLILGTRGRKPTQFMNVEISGLPNPRTRHTRQLRAVRDAFAAVIDQTRLGLPNVGGDYDFYVRPFPVIVEGSLFFDISHADVGPPDARAGTVWEIHPVSAIEFLDDGEEHDSVDELESVIDRGTVVDIAEFPTSSRKVIRTSQTDPDDDL